MTCAEADWPDARETAPIGVPTACHAVIVSDFARRQCADSERALARQAVLRCEAGALRRFKVAARRGSSREPVPTHASANPSIGARRPDQHHRHRHVQHGGRPQQHACLVRDRAQLGEVEADQCVVGEHGPEGRRVAVPAACRPGQQASPSANNATPATRPSATNSPDRSAPSSSATTSAGSAIRARPVAASTTAVSVRTFVVCMPLVFGSGNCFRRGLLVRRRQLRRPELEGQLVDRAR